MVSSLYEVAAMRVVQGFGALIKSEGSARAADIAFLDSTLELTPEDQNSSADSLHTGRLIRRQRHRFYNNAPRTKAKQTTNEEDKQEESWKSIALNGKPARKQENTRQGRKSIALNGKPAVEANLSEPDFHLVNHVTGEGEIHC